MWPKINGVESGERNINQAGVAKISGWYGVWRRRRSAKRINGG
jgi:hypothetical protein